MRIPLSLALISFSSVVHAQVDTTRRDTVRLSPTVVTVTRLPLELERAPFAIAVNERDAIQRGRPGFALDEALAGIAGVQVDNRFNYALGERITIRGFGARAQFGVRGVRVLLDGIPMTLADGQTALNNVDVATIARAEVMRGPASALHGNASGGVIQLETERDDELRTSGNAGRTELRVTGGENGLLRYQIGARHAAARQWASVTASHLDFDSYRAHNQANNDHVQVQAGRYFSVGSLTLTGNWVDYEADNPGSLPRDSARLRPHIAWPANDTLFVTGEEGRQGQYGAVWRQELRGAALEVSGHALQRSVDNPIPQRIVVIDRTGGGGRVAITGSPSLDAVPIRLAVGSEFQMQRDDRKNFQNVRGERGVLALDQLERVRNLAFFTQLSADVMPRLALMAGVRHDRINFRANDRLVTTGDPTTDESGERDMNATSPSIGLTVSAARNVSVYSNFSTSFETPTTSELANQESGAGGFNPALEPQRTRSTEVGVNGRVTLARVVGSYQLAVYDARVRDALIPFEVASAPGRQYFRNAGSTKNRGVEAATSLVLPRGFALRASYTHTDARFDDYAVTVGPTTTVYDGNQIPGVAANRGDATLSFQPSRFFVDWDTRIQSRVPVNDANDEYADSYVIHGLRVGARDVRAGALSVSPHIGVMNLFDRAYSTSVVVNAFGRRYYEPGPPRSLYAGVSARF
jgi:iron complex outermembrane receptor protein